MRYRSMDLTIEPIANPNEINFIASTDNPQDIGNYREVLQHSIDNIDMKSLSAVLLNHDPNQIIGSVKACMIENGRACAKADIMPEAKMLNGISVKQAIDSKALRGVSIGYTYSPKDTTYDKETRAITVHKWRLLEMSLTPVPMDSEGGLRSLQKQDLEFIESIVKINVQEIKTKEAKMAEDNKKADDTVSTAKAPDEQAIVENIRAISNQAEKHGLKPSDYIGMRKEVAFEKMLVDLSVRESTQIKATPTPNVMFNQDVVDKLGLAAENAIMGRSQVAEHKDLQGNPFAGKTLTDIARLYAMQTGVREASEWDKRKSAYFILGDYRQMGTRDANVQQSQFPNFVFLNAITKIVGKGFENSGSGVNYQRISEIQRVPDFKQFSIGALGASNLSKTAENLAFPELTYTEGVYNSTVKMWGGTVSLTVQALIGDDTAQFERVLRQAGNIAQKTINKRVYQKLLMGTSSSESTSTWTNNTTGSATLAYTTADTSYAARANISKVIAALMNKVGQDGNPLGTQPRYLVVPATQYGAVVSLLNGGGGTQVGNLPYPIEVIGSPWLEASTLTGYSTTSYYVLGDPMEVTGLVVSLINGFDTVQVQEYDAQAVAARKWKLWLPFEADLVTTTNSDGTTIIPAAQQGTA